MNTPNTLSKDLGWRWPLAIIGLVVFALWALIVTSNPHGHRVPQTACINNLKQIGVALEMYASAWGDRRPPLYTTDQRAPDGKTWPDLLMPYLKKLDPTANSKSLTNRFRCPDSTGDRLTYSINPRTTNMPVGKMKYPSVTICVFDSVSDSPENNNLNGDTMWRPSDGGVPPAGSLVIWPHKQPLLGPKLPEWAKPRHHSRTEILFVDGHVISVSLSSPPEPSQYAPRFDPAKPAH